MITRKEFSAMVEEIAPLSLALPWDNSGMNISLHDEIKKVFMCLDLTENSIAEAEKLGCDTILTHHPILFRPLKTIDSANPVAKNVLLAVRKNMNVYSAHTSFDCSDVGTDAVFSKLLGMENCEILDLSERIGRAGDIDECSAEELIGKVKEALKIEKVRTNGIRKNVKKIACIGGAGGSYHLLAKAAGADALITGEAKYNDFIDSAEIGLLLIETGHFDSEKAFVSTMQCHLQTKSDVLKYNLDIYAYMTEKAPYDFI